MDIGSEEFCRICYSDCSPIDNSKDLISPCNCIGSVKYVHNSCLKLWRLKGKVFRDIKRCEQCHGYYKIPGEINLNTISKFIMTVCIISSGYFIFSLFIKAFFDALYTVLLEVTCGKHFNSKDLLSNNFNPNDFLDTISYENIIITRNNTVYHTSHYLTLPFHMCCILLTLSVYKTFKYSNLFAIMNYLFTFWRLINFEFTVDKVLFLIFSVIFLKELFNDIYDRVDGVFYYLRNVNLEGSLRRIY